MGGRCCIWLKIVKCFSSFALWLQSCYWLWSALHLLEFANFILVVILNNDAVMHTHQGLYLISQYNLLATWHQNTEWVNLLSSSSIQSVLQGQALKWGHVGKHTCTRRMDLICGAIQTPCKTAGHQHMFQCHKINVWDWKHREKILQ